MLVMVPQWIKSTRKSKVAPNSSCIFLGRICAYNEIHIAVTEVGQVKQSVKGPNQASSKFTQQAIHN